VNGIYLDWAATAQPHQEILREALERSMTLFGNPSSQHEAGKAARAAFEEARAQLALALRTKPERIVFTSGATETNALILTSLLKKQGHSSFAVSELEHPSIYELAREIDKLGHELKFLKSDADGFIRPEEAACAVEGGARFIAVMAVNNETGAVQDIAAIAKAIRAAERGPRVHFHVDAVQALGKTPFFPEELDIDSASFSAHKIGGPRGEGFLWLRRYQEVLLKGGGQEGGLRSGTENAFGAFALAETATLALSGLERNRATAAELMATLIGGLRARSVTILPESRAERDERFSPFILQASARGIPAEVLTRALSDQGVYISTGSACKSSHRERRVLEAMGVGEELSLSAFRVSIGPATTNTDISGFFSALDKSLAFLRK
jgi:cysteine desulfurase